MNKDITWLRGRLVLEVQKMDYSWFFRMDDGSVISTESFWRLVTPKGVSVTSEDQDQKFGLPAPVDAASVAKAELAGHSVTQYHLDPTTGDLYLEFDSISLQFPCTSGGYESWTMTHGGQNLICTGGGRIVEFDQHMK